MDEPPPYEESLQLKGGSRQNDSKVTPPRFSIRDEVSVGRSQHVAAVMSSLLPQIRSRAQQGLSKCVFLLLPAHQESNHTGQLVGYPEDELPILVQLEGSQDTLQFWAQQDVHDLLRRQLIDALTDEVVSEQQVETPPPALVPPAVAKSSFWSRKQSKTPQQSSALPKVVVPTPPPLSIDVHIDEAHFRSETDYGLYQTLRARCLSVTVDVQ